MEEGYLGVYLLRQNIPDGVQFVTLTLWESMDTIQLFAGEDYGLAVVPPEARVVPARFDERSIHIETIIRPDKG